MPETLVLYSADCRLYFGMKSMKQCFIYRNKLTQKFVFGNSITHSLELISCYFISIYLWSIWPTFLYIFRVSDISFNITVRLSKNILWTFLMFPSVSASLGRLHFVSFEFSKLLFHSWFCLYRVPIFFIKPIYFCFFFAEK